MRRGLGTILRRFSGSALQSLKQRGFVCDQTHPDAELESVFNATAGGVRAYCGFDPTADGLHVGNMVALMALAHLQRHGHTPVVLVGGFTGLVGDPSGRDTERTLLDEQVARDNCARVAQDAKRVLDASIRQANEVNSVQHASPTTLQHNTSTSSSTAFRDAIFVNNADWYQNMSVLTMLRDVGRHFRVPAMLRRESVARRMQSQDGISFTEFSYQLLQSHDFYHLHSTLGVSLQLGGSDQWGNITAGIEYAKRRGAKSALCGITLPLVQGKDGAKLGKSAGNAVWLSERKTSHFDLYQYFVRTPTDAIVRDWLLLLTFLPEKTIDEACARADGSAQRLLAKSVVELVRGAEAAHQAEEAAKALYEDEESGSSSSVPTVNVSRASLEGQSVVDVSFVIGLAASKAEAKRLVQQGGLYLNNVRVEDANAKIEGFVSLSGNQFLARAGKKKRLVVKIE